MSLKNLPITDIMKASTVLIRNTNRPWKQQCLNRSSASFNPSIDYIYSKTDESELSYIEARPFEEIPGPTGLPYLGTLLQYRIGNQFIIWLF